MIDDLLPRGSAPSTVGLSYPPGPLTEGTVLKLPERARFAPALAKLEESLQTRYLRAIYGRFAKANSASRTAALQKIQADFDKLVEALRLYLDADFVAATVRLFKTVPLELDRRKSRAQNAKRARVAKNMVENIRLLTEVVDALQDPEGPGIRFAELTRGTIFTSGEPDALEQRLAPKVTELTLMSDRLTEEGAQDLVAWFRLTRVGIATAVVRAVPSSRVWGEVAGLPKKAPYRRGIYGTLGHWLSENVPRLATVVARHPALAALRESPEEYPWMPRYVAYDGDPGPLQYPIGRHLQRIEEESTAWREHCAREGCAAAEKGELWPFEFVPLTAEEHGDKSIPAGSTPDHMHARPTATRRVLEVRGHWEFVRDLLELPDNDLLRFKINAGSLRFGGAHPPHTTHRNGAMFDLDLTVAERGAIDPICEQQITIEISAPRIRRASEAADPPPFEETAPLRPPARPTGEEADGLPDFLRGQSSPIRSNFVVLEPLPDETPAEIVSFCATDFTYAEDRLVEGKKPEVIARRFTQCMLLTFPTQVLFASWGVLRDAWNELYDTVNYLVAEDDPSLGDDGRAALKQLQQYFAVPAPDAVPPERRFRALFPRDDHDDHWHISFDPRDVDEDAFERVRSLVWIAANRDRFFPEETIDE